MNKTNGSTRTNSFSSLASMRETHSELLARLDEHGDLPEFLDEVETFVNRG